MGPRLLFFVHSTRPYAGAGNSLLGGLCDWVSDAMKASSLKASLGWGLASMLLGPWVTNAQECADYTTFAQVRSTKF